VRRCGVRVDARIDSGDALAAAIRDRRRQHQHQHQQRQHASGQSTGSIPFLPQALALGDVDALVLEDVVADIGRLAVVQPGMAQRVALRVKAVDPRRIVLQQMRSPCG
jgi:hypothetical protein